MDSFDSRPLSRQHFLRRAAVGIGGILTPSFALPLLGPAGISRASSAARKVPPSNGLDDRAAIQAVLDEGPGDVVFGANQTWIIDSTLTSGGLSPRSGTRLVLEENAVLQVKPNADEVTRLIDIGRDGPVSDISIEGSGVLLGDLDNHLGTTGEWGHLIHITNGSANIKISGPLLLKQAWGDGIYIGDGAAVNYDVLIDGVTIEDCRREGIAPFWVDGCTISNSTVVNIGATRRTAPSSGIDCEPNDGQYVTDLTIEHNTIKQTSGCGIYVSANPGPVTRLMVRDNTILNCGLTNDRFARYQRNGIHVAAIDNPMLINNVISGSGYDGRPNGTSGQIFLRSVTRPVISEGLISDGLGPGILLTRCDAPLIEKLTIQNSKLEAISVHRSNGTVIRDCIFVDNATSTEYSADHLEISASDETLVSSNIFRGEAGSAWINVDSGCLNTRIADNTGDDQTPPVAVRDDGEGTLGEDGGIKTGN